MKKSFQLVALLLGILLSAGCSAPAKNSASKYRFKGFDSDGKLLAQGTFQLEVLGADKVEGQWEFHIVKPVEANRSHPLSGSGRLIGTVQGSTINLDLNPGWTDNNVRLEGEVTTTNILGKWGFYGFAGRMFHGKFQAVKK